jgi:hypothetical protein
MNLKATFAAITLALVIVGAAATITSFIVQPAIAGDSDGGDGTGGGGGKQGP